MNRETLTQEDKDFVAPETGDQAAVEEKGGLFSITENEDGTVDAVMPGRNAAYVMELGFAGGTEVVQFASIDLAQAAIEKKQNFENFLKELWSFKMIQKDHLFQLEQLGDDNYRVTIPGLKALDGDYYVGTYEEEFNSWEGARQFLLEYFEDHSELTKNPILELNIDDSTKLAFSDFKAFDPKVAPTNKRVPVPESFRRSLITSEKYHATENKTYQKTKENLNWQSEIYSFIEDYLKKEGSGFLETYGIKNLKTLSPKQAMLLSTAIVTGLTKYNHGETSAERSKNGELVPTKSDQSSVLGLLEDGRENIGNSDWEGNGVCRNFAAMVKAVFESLKANQTEFSMLTNTYALYERGSQEFRPKRGEEGVTTLGPVDGHAWNTFVTISHDGSVNATIGDVTWARQSLETHELENIDYTLTRMEPVVYEFAYKFTNEQSDELRKVLEYYHLKARTPGQTGGHSSVAEQTEYFVSQAMKLVRKHESMVISPEFATFAFHEYERLSTENRVTRDDLEGLIKIWQANPVLDIRPILDKYIETHSKILDDYSIDSGDYWFSNPELIKYVLITFSEKPDFEKAINANPSVRHNVRNLTPKLLNENPVADNLELHKQIKKIDEFRNIFTGPEKIREIIASIRSNLQRKDPEYYAEFVEELDDFQLVDQYYTIRKQIRGNS